MARTKGATNKPKSTTTTSEPDTPKKTRGRQKGEKVETNIIIVQLNDDYRVKIDKRNLCLQEKAKTKEQEETDIIDDEEEKDPGWSGSLFFPVNKLGWQALFERLVAKLTKEKAKKVVILSMDKYLKYFNQANEEVIKMFAPLEYKQLKIDMGDDE